MTQVRYLEFMPAKKYLVALTQLDPRRAPATAKDCPIQPSQRSGKDPCSHSAAGRYQRQGRQPQSAQIAGQLRCTSLTVSTVRQRATQRGALPSVKHKEQERRKARALDGEQEAHLVALTCSAAPQGRKRWTLQLLKDRLIQMEVVENIGMETIRRTLKKTNSNRG